MALHSNWPWRHSFDVSMDSLKKSLSSCVAASRRHHAAIKLATTQPTIQPVAALSWWRWRVDWSISLRFFFFWPRFIDVRRRHWKVELQSNKSAKSSISNSHSALLPLPLPITGLWFYVVYFFFVFLYLLGGRESQFGHVSRRLADIRFGTSLGLSLSMVNKKIPQKKTIIDKHWWQDILGY